MNVVLMMYLAIINLAGYISMGVDKKKAKKGSYRISEKSLFIIALIGGSLGSILGMQYFRHKTKHWYFKFGMPLIFVIETIGLVLILNPSYIEYLIP